MPDIPKGDDKPTAPKAEDPQLQSPTIKILGEIFGTPKPARGPDARPPLTEAAHLDSSPKATPPKDSDRLDVRLGAAANKRTAPDALTKLAADEDTTVRSLAARNGSTPPETLSKLADDQSENVRLSVAENPFSPPEALAKLAGDPAAKVRATIASNEFTAPEVLSQLAGDDNQSVRLNVAENASSPAEALLRLESDGDSKVRTAAGKSLDGLDENVTVARDEKTEPQLLSSLAQDKDWNARAHAAVNSSTPPDVLSKLAEDKDWRVRLLLARNRSTPPEALALLADDEKDLVRTSVFGNTSTPPDARSKLAREENTAFRTSAAERSTTLPDALSILRNDSNPQVAQQASRNLDKLVQEPLNPDVFYDAAHRESDPAKKGQLMKVATLLQDPEFNAHAKEFFRKKFGSPGGGSLASIAIIASTILNYAESRNSDRNSQPYQLPALAITGH